MVFVQKFAPQLEKLSETLGKAKKVLLTAPAAADGDSIGAQLALRRMILGRFKHLSVSIVNGEPLPPRYQFLPDVESVETPESAKAKGDDLKYDLGVLVDGGADRTGTVLPIFEACPTTVFIDHHIVSCEFPYTIRIVEPGAAATTELIFHISQSPLFQTPVDAAFAQHIFLGIVFDTGFFRHSNTTPEVMELGARLMRTGLDFTRLGERGMLERSYSALRLLSDALTRSELRAGGKIIWSKLTLTMMDSYRAIEDDREGIIDQLFLTSGIDVAVLFIELRDGTTKLSFRSHGRIDVADFARSLTAHGGGHKRAAGANLEMGIDSAIKWVLERLEASVR